MKKIIYLFLVISLFSSELSNAAVCASVGVDDTLVVNTTPVGECDTLVIMSASEWPGQSIYAIPSVQDAVDLWMVGFTVPMGLFLFSWGVGSVVRMWRLPRESS